MGPEAKLWKALKPHLDAHSCFSTRIENRHGGGLPDVDVCSPVGVFKIELKVCQNFSVRISDMQIAYNTLLTHKNGLSFILAEVPAPSNPLQNANPFLQNANEDQGPRTEDIGSGSVGSGSGRVRDIGSGSVGSGRGKLGRGRSGLGPRTSDGVGSGRGHRYRLWHGRDAVDVGRVGLRAEALASGDSLPELVAAMLRECAAHHARLLEKAPRL